jgi:hypothetical protein
MKSTITETLNILGKDLNIDFVIDYYIDNDGIGDFEYAGFKGYNKGSDYPVVEGIEWDKSLYSDQQNAEIKKQTDLESFIINIEKNIKL